MKTDKELDTWGLYRDNPRCSDCGAEATDHSYDAFLCQPCVDEYDAHLAATAHIPLTNWDDF